MAAPVFRTVPPSTGAAWARRGLDTLAAAPATWLGIVLLFILVGIVLSVIPFAGMLWSVVIPIHVGGLMMGCRALDQGQPLEVRHLFNGFEAPRLQPLALVGALYLAGTLILILPLILIVVAGTLLSAATVGAAGVGAVGSLVGVGVVVAIVFLLTMAGGIVLSLALWFAPALVVFDEVQALDALKLSLRAGWANIGAFVVYGLVVLGIALVAASPLLATLLLVAAQGNQQPGPMAVVMLGGTGLFACLCLLLLMPAAWGAMYASYEDTFGQQQR